uniref:SFRICE_004026 n=1 Tax=Spodoptera frugiperda TaxID=7108 RepID=A0A2H1W1A7_SPOFR
MFSNTIAQFSLCALLLHQEAKAQTGPIAGFIRTNLIGHPVIHDKASWVFDPDVAIKRRRQFISLHGDKGEKLIERLGLGIDGRDEERLEEQRKRDKGHLGGLNYYLP